MNSHQDHDPSTESIDTVRIRHALHARDFDTAAKLILLAAARHPELHQLALQSPWILRRP